MSSGVNFFRINLFTNATGLNISPEFTWQGGRLEMIAHATTFGGLGVSLQVQAPDDVWVPVSDMFLKSDGTVSGILCPGMIRGTIGNGSNTLSAWVIGVPD